MTVVGYREKRKGMDVIHISPFGMECRKITLSKKAVEQKRDTEVCVKGLYFKINIPHKNKLSEITWKERVIGGIPEKIKKESLSIMISGQFIHQLLCLRFKKGLKKDLNPLTKRQLSNINKNLRRSIDMSESLGTAY